MNRPAVNAQREETVAITATGVSLEGTLVIPPDATSVVLFAHGSGSSRHSPRNRAVAQVLNLAGMGTLLIDLLTADEEAIDQRTAHLRFDIPFLAGRLVAATDWLVSEVGIIDGGVGYFGASTGAGAALVAAAQRTKAIGAVVSRGGRPDLAGDSLTRVEPPTLLIVGGNDTPVITMNQEAMERMPSEKRLEIIPGATHLFPEPGALEEVARLARDWFAQYLA
jgi:putative phosphoribosyl transferase